VNASQLAIQAFLGFQFLIDSAIIQFDPFENPSSLEFVGSLC